MMVFQKCPECSGYTTEVTFCTSEVEFKPGVKSGAVCRLEVQRKCCECGHVVTDPSMDVDLDASPPGKVFIAGTGRAGTTFLIRLLTALGLDTGYPQEVASLDPCPAIFLDSGGSGFEVAPVKHPVFQHVLPAIVKGPGWSVLLREFLEAGCLTTPRHVLIPFRDLSSASGSRVAADLPWGKPVPTPEEQRSFLSFALGECIATCIEYRIPYTIMRYPWFIESAEVCRADFINAIPGIMEIAPEVFAKTHRQIADLGRRSVPC